MENPDFTPTETKSRFSFNEACEFLKRQQTKPTTRSIAWKRSITGKRVVIGINNLPKGNNTQQNGKQ